MDKIYINLTTEGKYGVEYKRNLVIDTIIYVKNAVNKQATEYAEMFGFTKQAVYNHTSHKNKCILPYIYSYASINYHLLKDYYENTDINIDKINDIIFCNTDNYSEEQIQAAISILNLLSHNSYNKYYNNVIKEIQKIIE